MFIFVTQNMKGVRKGIGNIFYCDIAETTAIGLL